MKVVGPNSLHICIYLEWLGVVGCGSKNEHWNNMCLKEIGHVLIFSMLNSFSVPGETSMI